MQDGSSYTKAVSLILAIIYAATVFTDYQLPMQQACTWLESMVQHKVLLWYVAMN